MSHDPRCCTTRHGFTCCCSPTSNTTHSVLTHEPRTMTNPPSEPQSKTPNTNPQNRAECSDAVSGQSDPVREWVRAVRELGEAVGSVVDALRRAGVVPEQPPVDPRERALWLRRHRGTGPGRPVQEQRRRR